jgi:hypothetical protein
MVFEMVFILNFIGNDVYFLSYLFNLQLFLAQKKAYRDLVSLAFIFFIYPLYAIGLILFTVVEKRAPPPNIAFLNKHNFSNVVYAN